MVLKIRVSVVLSKSAKLMRLKWRRKRGVVGLRPPPGGPIAEQSTVSTMLCHAFSFRSYQPPLSMNWRSNSIGGCAPYVSTSGMLRSSTKMMAFWPSGGPYTPLRRLSSFSSMVSCVIPAVVLAEKPRQSGLYLSWFRLLSSVFMMLADLPVPVGPQMSTGMSSLRSSSRR